MHIRKCAGLSEEENPALIADENERKRLAIERGRREGSDKPRA